MNKQIDVYELFSKEFIIGTNVIIIDEDDNFIFGKIVDMDFDRGIRLIKQFYSPYSKWYPWETMRFICHDGFPVRKLFPRSSDKYLVHLDTTNIISDLRRLTVSEICNNCGLLIEASNDNKAGWSSSDGEVYLCPNCSQKEYSMRGGHPFEIENVKILICNPGNVNNYYNYVDDTFIETAILTSRDGLVGHLWDLATIFELC